MAETVSERPQREALDPPQASKNEMIRYTLGTIFSLTAVAFGIVRYATLSGSPRRDSALGEGVEGRALPFGER